MHPRFVVGLMLLALGCLPSAAAADQPVRVSAGFGGAARLGGEAPLHFGVEVDVARLPSPATEVRLYAPAGIDIGSLGVATCSVPPATLQDVLFSDFPPLRCPRNAVIGRGTATAALVFDAEERPIRGDATITLYSGEAQDDRPGLLVLAQTYNPVSTQMVYAGRLDPARRPFGLGLTLQIRAPAVAPFGATVALERMRVTIGGRDLVYTRPARGKLDFYRPGGVGLPSRCPRGGLPFRADIRFADDSRRTVVTRAPCPRPLR